MSYDLDTAILPRLDDWSYFSFTVMPGEASDLDTLFKILHGNGDMAESSA